MARFSTLSFHLRRTANPVSDSHSNKPNMKPKYNTSKLRNSNLGASLVTAITICFGGSASAATWVGDTSGDWNDNLNWSGDAGTVGSNATINTDVPNIATISADIPGNPVDIFVGNGAGTNATLVHTAGAASTGANNWTFIGRAGGTGVYNLTGGAAGAGTHTLQTQGAGSFTGGGTGDNGRLYIGGNNGAGSNGTVNVNTTGILTVNSQMEIGTNTSVGVLNLDSGTINTGKAAGEDDWFEIGNGTGSTGTINMSGGSINKVGNQHFIVGANGSTGFLNISGGAINVNNEFWVANNGGSNGTLNLSGSGSITNGSWVAIGRNGSVLGTVNQSGGTWTKNGAGSSFIVGASGPGVYNQSGGLVDVVAGDTWMGEAGTCTYTLSGSGEFRATFFQVARNGGSTGNVNLNGGTLRANQIVGGGGTENVSFNGTQIVAKQDQTNFIGGMDALGATIDAGGLLIDSAGFTLTAPQVFDGTGGVIKSGLGTLTLSGGNSYTGDNTIAGGSLVLSTASTGGGGVSLANGTALGVNSVFAGGQLISSAATFGTSAPTTLNLNLGDVFGSNPTNSILDVTGALTVNGVVTVNVAGAKFAVGNLPLVSFNSAANPSIDILDFVLGTKPNGVVGTLQVDPNFFGAGLGAVYLDITSVSLPEWDGTNEVLLAVSGDTTDLSADITVTDATGIVVGQTVRGDGIPNGTTVSVITGLVITLSQPATATATGVNFSFVTTPGTNEGVWDTVTQNWIDQVTTLNSLYSDPAPVLFSDIATGPTAVVLNTTVAPSEVVFNNNTLVYSLSGTGAITGAGGLTKQGTAGLTLSITNTYDGATRLEGGTTSIATFLNGGVPSPIGDSSSAAANLVLAGGTLAYTGPSTTTDRGISIAGANDNVVGGLNLTNNLTLSGPITASLGKLIKTGPGTLTLTNPGANILAVGSNNDADPQSFRVEQGDLVFDGAGQTNTVGGRTGLGTGGGFVTNVSLINGATFTGNGRTLVGVAAGAQSTLTVSGTSSMQLNDAFQISMTATSIGNVIIQDSGSITKTGGWLSIGNDGVGTMLVKNSGTLTANGDFNVSDVGVSTGTLSIQDVATVSASGPVFIGKNTGTSGTLNISGGTLNSTNSFFVASSTGSIGAVSVTGGLINHTGGELLMGRNGAGTWTQNAGTVNANGWAILGRDATGTGTMNISGGSFTQTQVDRPFMIGEFGIGILNVSGTAQVSSLGANGLILANEPSGTGTVNLDGGTLTVRRVREGNDGNAGVGGLTTFNFNGGTLQAGAGANANFMSGLNTAVIGLGHAFIDSNSQVVTISQALDDGGGDLHKIGAGTLRLDGASSYLGTTFVDVGTLGGIGSVSGPLVVAAAASVNPGVTAGTFSADSADISGKYLCEIDGGTADQLAVAGALTIQPGATLDFSVLAAPAAPSFVIATFTSLSGSFVELNVPVGFSVVYNANNISLVQTATPYSTWAASFGLNPFTDGAPGADKDNDGQSNGIEFALGGSPISGSDNARIYNLMADSSADGDALSELLMTIAVRTGTPAFAGSPSPTAAMDGATYTVEGSTTLSSFTTIVTPVAPVITGLPAAPAGYEYRTFSLDGSNGTAGPGFLRVQVNF